MSTQPWNPHMTKAQAEQQDKKIHALVAKMQRARQVLVEDQERFGCMVTEMLTGQGWKPLGYRSAAMWLATLVSNEISLRDVLEASGMSRTEFVGRLHDSGKTNRAIADSLGVDSKTIDRDTEKWLDSLRNSADELTNSDNESEDVEPEPFTVRPEARVKEAELCIRDGFDDALKRVKGTLATMLHNPEYQQAQKVQRWLRTLEKQVAQVLSQIEAAERERTAKTDRRHGLRSVS